jgi:hypothetical protein
MTTSRASRASTGGSVLPGGAVGQVLTKRSGTNDDLAWGDINITTYNNPTASGLVTTQAAGGTAETVVSGMSVSNLQPGVVASVNLLLYVSMNDFGTVKGVTMRLRDGGLTGTILQSVVRPISTDTSTGHDVNFAFTGNVTPATNTLVVTVQRTSTSTVAVLSDTRTFTVSQSGGGFTPVGGTTGQVLTKTTSADLNYGWASPTAPAKTVNTQTGTAYTLVLGDANNLVDMNNAAASTLTVPPNSNVAFPVGTIIEGNQLGAGQVTLTPGSGVTINATPGLKVAAQYGTYGLRKTATDTWLAYGRLSS